MLLSFVILLFLGINWAGNELVSRLSWPLWLDSVGTVMSAYLLGPVCGAIVGATSNLLLHVLYGIPWYYALISMLIAVIVGVAARRNKLSTLLDVMTISAILAGVVAVCAYPVNLILQAGSTGNVWGDAVIGFLGERGIPRWAGLFVGELYVELLDKLVILLALFLEPLFGSIPSAATAPVLVIVGLMMVDPIREIDYGDYAESIPAFMTIIVMVCASSISEGIMFGVLFYVFNMLITRRFRDLSPAILVVAALFIVKILLTIIA